MKQYRLNNDVIDISWSIYQTQDLPEDFTNAENIHFELRVGNNRYEKTPIIQGNEIRFHFLASEQKVTGVYNLYLSYQKEDLSVEGGRRTFTLDYKGAFELVDRSWKIDTLSPVEIQGMIEQVRGLSAYEVAVKNGFIGTEEEWIESLHLHLHDLTEQEIAELQQPATDTIQATLAAKEAIEANEDNRNTNENERKANELNRIESEQGRVSAETERKTNEDYRLANEIIRVSKETERQDNEATRKSNEVERVSNEDDRKSNDTERVSNENDRKSAETLRLSAESLRASNESIRTSNENARQSNETTRISNENTRKQNEEIRQTNETSRQQLKSELETLKTDTTSAKNAANDAASNANNAANSANTAATAANNAAQSANNSATSANNAATNASTQATAASSAASLANVAATNANNAVSGIDNRLYKTLNIGNAGLITLSPTTSYFTYRLNVTDNVILNIDLQRMINQIGNARCRLIIDMPIVRTITLTKPILWCGTVQTFASAGQYIFEIIDVDGTGTPLIWQVASTTKVQQTGVILYVDSTSADYSTSQINGETATRTTSTWALPFKYLQNAINAANAGDMIFVKAGTYYPTHLRTTPTSYADGDYQRRDATFTMKTGVDVYGGFLGTESKTWQRVVDSKGFPVNKSILNGDIKREAAIDGAKTIGDLRTDASKVNAAYNVVYANVASYTYLNGFDVKYGNANGSSAPTDRGGGISNANLNLVSISCTAYNNSAANYGGGWSYGTNTNCTAYNNSAANYGGGWYSGTNTNCTAYNNSAADGGGWYSGTNTNCTAYNNSTTNGGGWTYGTNTNCTSYNNSATYGGGWYYGTNTNCTAYNNSATHGGGWIYGTNTNCTAYNNSATYGGGWSYGTNTNCNCITNKGNSCIYIGTDLDITNINCLLINNKTNSNGIATIFGSSSSKIYKFRNNVYDCPNPTLSGGAGSDIDFTSCKPNITLNDVKIDVPSFVGLSANDTQLQELKDFATNIITHLKPKSGSILKGAGINNATYSNPTDFAGIVRPANCTVGILEGE